MCAATEVPPSAAWAHFAHAADIGLRGTGPSLEAAFVQAAFALTAVVTDPARVRSAQCVDIDCEAPDPELLLVDWLNRLVYEMSSRGLVFGRFEVRIEGPRLRGRACGEPVQRRRHRPTVEVKGATYTGLSVRREDGRWIAECVVDV